jgi:hypothetical protein
VRYACLGWQKGDPGNPCTCIVPNVGIGEVYDETD